MRRDPTPDVLRPCGAARRPAARLRDHQARGEALRGGRSAQHGHPLRRARPSGRVRSRRGRGGGEGRGTRPTLVHADARGARGTRGGGEASAARGPRGRGESREGGRLMRELFAVACRAFPPGHRARRSDEVVDTALLAAEGSLWGGAREAVSLVAAGMHQRLRAEAARSWRHGASLLAGVLGVVNLAVAVAGLTSGFGTYSGPSVLLWGVRYGRLSVPFIIDA